LTHELLTKLVFLSSADESDPIAKLERQLTGLKLKGAKVRPIAIVLIAA